MEIAKKILIVDDKAENLVALELLLKAPDIEIIKAKSGNEALEKTIEHDFALALIDVQMPEMDGFETVKLMRHVEKTKFLPVIFLSAIYSEEHYHIMGLEAGAVDFISKPFKKKILLGKTKVFLELYEQKKRLELEIEQRKQTEESLREAEKELIEAKLKAEESDRLKTAFLANMSHEIRTPLTSIVGFAGLLSESELPLSTKKEFAGYIHKSSDNLINIINDILDVAKIEAGQLKINKERVNIHNILKELHYSFKDKLGKMAKGNINLVLNLPTDQDLFLFTDESRFVQVFTNLLSNASKFTLEGTIEFGYVPKKEIIEFYVRDSGVGIPSEKYEMIFDRFQKLHNEKVQNSSGTGLGLSIVKKIVEMLGGSISVNSELNKGSVFTFSIPNEDIKPRKREKVQSSSDGIPENIDWSDKHILIAEDEFPTYYLLESILSPTGVNIKWVQNGREAVEAYLNDKDIDAVLMDIRMPVMSGVEAYKELRKINNELPIIAQTAYAMTEEKESLQEMGFNGYLTKPIIKKELFRLLNMIL